MAHSIDATTSIKALLAIASTWTAAQTFQADVTLEWAAGTNNADLIISNTSNTAIAAHAVVDVKVGGTTSVGDPQVRLTVPSGTSWYMGVDNSASDTFIIGTGTAVGTNPFIQVVSGGNMTFTAGGSVIFPTAGQIFLNDTANGQATAGLTLNQGAATNEILSLKQSGVAHGMTTRSETDTFGYFSTQGGAVGGLLIAGLCETTGGIEFQAGGVTDTTTKATSSGAFINFYSAKKSGTTFGDPGTNANIAAFLTWTTGARVLIDAEGDVHTAGNFVAGFGDGNTTAVTGTAVRAPHMIGGTTSDAAGADLIVAAGQGTGIGDVGQVIVQLPVVGVTGSVVQTLATRLTLDMVAGNSLYVESAGTGANGMILKNLKNAAATALSGTQLDIEIDIGGTPYYFTVYPTKA